MEAKRRAVVEIPVNVVLPSGGNKIVRVIAEGGDSDVRMLVVSATGLDCPPAPVIASLVLSIGDCRQIRDALLFAENVVIG